MNKLERAAALAAAQSIVNSAQSQSASDPLFDNLQGVVGDFISRIKDNITSEGAAVTGSIADINIETEPGRIHVVAPMHLEFQDKGVNGSKQALYNTPYSYKDKRPPYSVFYQWIKQSRKLSVNAFAQTKYNGRNSGKQKGQKFRELDTEKAITSAAYALREKIFQDGFKPRQFYSKELPKLEDDLQAATGKAIETQFNRLFANEKVFIKVTI